MQDKRILDILQLLADTQFHTAQNIADHLGLSSKTIRGLIKQADAWLKKEKAGFIASKHGKGYQLIIADQECYDRCIDLHLNKKGHIPINAHERVQYILEYLLNCKGYVKIATLQDALYVSRNTLVNDIKEAEKELNRYNLTLIRKPSYGIKVVGKEFGFRLCIANHIAEREKSGVSHGFGSEHKQEMKIIADCVLALLKEQELSISDMAFQNLIIHIFVAIKRMASGEYVPIDAGVLKGLLKHNEYDAAKSLVKKLNKKFDIEFPSAEIGYIAIHLAGKKLLPGQESYHDNMVISPEINKIVTSMINNIYEVYNFDFRENIELRMALCQHLMSLEIRVQYDMKLKNPLLKDIKERFSLAYAMAAQACTVLNDHFKTRLHDDEIGYIALAFALALERHRTTIDKKNILLVCSTGKGSANLLKYRYMSEFGSYINKVETCEANEIDKMDLSGFDYVFTTVPIPFKIPIPIMEVQYFLDDKDINSIKKVLKKGIENDSVVHYYSRELFIPSLKCKTKLDVLKQMCQYLSTVRDIPDNFFDLVLERESLARTEFGNLVAIPYPNDAVTDTTFVLVAVLDDKIQWDDRDVQVIFLTTVEKDPKFDLQNFYTVTSKFLLSETHIQMLIRERDFDLFIKTMLEIEKEEHQGEPTA